MKIHKTKIRGVYVIEAEPKVDDRGYFMRIYAKEVLKKNKIEFDIVHINRSFTKQKGTIRGIHYQIKPHAENKIIQCLHGKVFDVAIDLRRNSKTFGKWLGVELSEKNKKMLLVPRGCGHAFQTLEKDTVVEYFVTEYYSPEYEKGIRWDDPFFKIQWPIDKPLLSEKDASWPLSKR
ncbi:MAG: dTDP-4-dehydrorhamnose 3,5-epimerase [Candidatus Levybacteria bacterium RIFCSPHIGHO2_02_FULL_40_18]|nr:MAG: dTDP-4-dehydrorhamnose 3,5-epimerase [Candidatus Levybacteria bacterium RIFCSPHIGHO2_01_FULL_40_58]OGH27185.1 MAG: dTDP-4-dehydrorhamnose 3,5-epimerase [Candidatus Levybacteria bacterium RIFCSPHIGHO2_02_FULL_40_18]OGH31044.1 MAG: dTDP-4-dehydrorhamnose 3,5-epimerase [Candidatus Levybacteria bacterium RIFCSPHIGHO2_12_FULL_40_31]OGH49426.1 MAG: dTDP-4-dehydrorhamnose 3,5-epimerase [Candidatus Levybacteria bacterium RIFCSPLOWO2_02_FULL_41_11]OGH53959.1 MAG: dTDP-4-dehydrorhamnose 3,5-epime